MPLTYAAYCKQQEIVSYLSFRVRDISPIDSLGYSALARCILNNQYEAAFKLTSRGANIDLQNLDGRTALTLMIIEENP